MCFIGATRMNQVGEREGVCACERERESKKNRSLGVTLTNQVCVTVCERERARACESKKEGSACLLSCVRSFSFTHTQTKLMM